MKKLTFLLLAAFSGMTASAQTEKGSHWIGGFFSANHTKNEQAQKNGSQDFSYYSKQNQLQIGPSYSYFVADKLSLTASAGYINSHADQTYYNAPGTPLFDQTTESSSNGYFAGLRLDKYFLYDNKIGVRTGPMAFYQRMNSNSVIQGEPEQADAITKSFSAGLTLDFVYFPVRKIGLIASIGSLAYSEVKFEGLNNTNKSSEIGLNFLGSSTSFSFVYVFGKK